ncbi:MAG: serine hydrolase domain-containing protein [Gemmatimonadaceae bacterium]
MHRTSCLLSLGCIAIAIASTRASGQQVQTAGAELAPRVDRIFAAYDGAGSPGCAVGVGRDGHTLYTHGYGEANLEYDVPITASSIFESGSVAKQFTAAAIVLLAQDGKLSLDDDIRRYLPEVPDFGQTIRIRHLLTHTSGLRDQWELLGIEGRGPGTQVHSPATTLDLVTHQKALNFPPGTEYSYSNTGYSLLGIIVQRVSGKSLDAFTQERLFKPLGMIHTRWRDDFTAIVKGRTTAYSGSATRGFRTDMSFTNMIGNGGLLTTVGDLLLWNENFFTPIVGGQAFVDSMQTRMTLRNGRRITYALGLDVYGVRWRYGGEPQRRDRRLPHLSCALSQSARLADRALQPRQRESGYVGSPGARPTDHQAFPRGANRVGRGDIDINASRTMGGELLRSADGSGVSVLVARREPRQR